MIITEKFVSIEGEGKRAGEVCAFIRVSGCNLRCSYCDTLYSQKPSDGNDESVSSIVAWLLNKAVGVRNITITGGEPLINPDVVNLVYFLLREGYFINVETNGSVNVSDFRLCVEDKWFRNNASILFPKDRLMCTVDFKCPSSGMRQKMCRDNFFYSYTLCENDVVKVVVGDEVDLDEVLLLRSALNSYIPIYVSPVWGKMRPVVIVDFLKANIAALPNTRLQLQLHKIIWDPKERGV